MELGRGLRSRLGSRTVEAEVWKTWARCSLRMRISSGTWLECDLQCGPSCVSVSASCVVEQPGRFWGRGGAGWVSSHARNLPHLALADSQDSTNPCHRRQNLGRLRMPPVLHRISPATVIRASSLAPLLVHGRHAIDKALLGKRNNDLHNNSKTICSWTWNSGTGIRYPDYHIWSGRPSPSPKRQFPFVNAGPLPVDVVDCFKIQYSTDLMRTNSECIRSTAQI